MKTFVIVQKTPGYRELHINANSAEEAKLIWKFNPEKITYTSDFEYDYDENEIVDIFEKENEID